MLSSRQNLFIESIAKKIVNNVFLTEFIPSTSMIVFNITSACNLNCKYCNQLRKDKVFSYSKEKLIDLANQFKDLGVELVVLTGGEPTIHPNFLEFSKKLLEYGIEVNFVTNGIFSPDLAYEISKLPFENVRMSVDSVIDYKKGMKNLNEFKKQNLKIILSPDSKIRSFTFSMVITKENFREIPQNLQELASLNEKIKEVNLLSLRDANEPAIMLDEEDVREFNEEILPKIKKVSERFKLDGVYEKAMGLFSRTDIDKITKGVYVEHHQKGKPISCLNSVYNVNISYDGNVFACNGHRIHYYLGKDLKDVIIWGNVLKLPLKEILENAWKNRELLKDPSKNKNCETCCDFYNCINLKIDELKRMN